MEPWTAPGFGNPRPQSHKFLQETLTKLTQDSIRAGSPTMTKPDAMDSRVARAPTSDMGLGPPDTRRSPRTWAGSRLSPLQEYFGDLRSAVREEVGTALDSGVVAQVLEGWSSQFAAWRKSDDHVVRQLKGHISELEDANRSLVSFLNEYITTSEFARFREAMNKYSNLVDELSDSHQGHESVLLSAVEHVVEKAVKAATSNIAQLIEEKMAQQVTRYATEQQRQIDTVLESVQTYASQVSRQLENQDVVLQAKLGSVMHDIGSEMQERMQKSADEINVSTLKAAHEGADRMKMVTIGEHEKLRSYMQRLIAGDEEELDENDEGLRPMLLHFRELLFQGVSTNEQAENWRKVSEQAESDMQAAKQELELCQTESAELQRKLTEAEANLAEQGSELSVAKVAMAKPWPWTRYAAFMDEISSRGQVKVNVYEEWVEITAGMGFAPRKEKQPPTAEWIDPASADAALLDALEVLRCLGEVPITIESHVKSGKGKADFWEAIAANRAELVRDALEEKGVPFRQMTATGLYGKAGLDRNCIILRVKLFPQNEAASQKGSPRNKAK
mmetsp:Transcript_8962/g.21237  ORF Transcript_8962/g.21237 Transcript_8962/m.21237 type:complete len:560 (-) Transcript_8962:53-1732(-)